MAGKTKKKSIVRKLIKWLIVLIILAILGALGYYVGLPMLKASVTTTYDTYTATTGTISNSLSFSGSVSIVYSEYLSSPAAGTVRDIYVKSGDDVKKGDKLVRISTGDTVKANFDGTINSISVEEGDNVSGGTQLCQVVDFSNMKVTMRVDEYDISEVYEGQECTITVTALEKSFPASISHINRLSSSSGSVAYYTVTAAVEVTEDVLPGMQVTVSIPKEEAKDVVVLKMDALSFDAFNSAFVYVMNEEGAMEQRYVEVGVDNGNYVEIKSGLEDGESVYVEVEEEVSAASGLQQLLGGLMGGTAINGPSGDRGGFSGGMPDMSSFTGGGMPDMSGFSGGQRGGSNGGNTGGGFPGGMR